MALVWTSPGTGPRRPVLVLPDGLRPCVVLSRSRLRTVVRYRDRGTVRTVSLSRAVRP